MLLKYCIFIEREEYVVIFIGGVDFDMVLFCDIWCLVFVIKKWYWLIRILSFLFNDEYIDFRCVFVVCGG